MLRRSLVLFAVVTALLLTSACGTDKDTDSTKKPAADDTTVDDTATDDPAVDDTDGSSSADPSADGSGDAANEALGITPEFCAVAKDAPESDDVQDYVDYYEKVAPVAPEVLTGQVDILLEKYRSIEEDGGTPDDAFGGDDGVAGEKLAVEAYAGGCP